MSEKTTDQGDALVVQNIETVLALRAREEEGVGRQQRVVERLTRALGRPRTLYIVLAVVAAWCGYNVVAPPLSWPVFDAPPFNWLQGALGLAALLMTNMVLTTQNRQGRHAEQRAHLDLQVNLLAEQKIAKLIGLLEELRRDLPNVHDRKDSVAEAMTQAVDAHAVITALEGSLDASHAGGVQGPHDEEAAPTSKRTPT